MVLQLSTFNYQLKRLKEIKAGQNSKASKWWCGYSAMVLWFGKLAFPLMRESSVSSKAIDVSSIKVFFSFSPIPVSLCASLVQFLIGQKTISIICFGGSSLLGSTDHRGTAEYPGRTVTLEPAEGEVCVSLIKLYNYRCSKFSYSLNSRSINDKRFKSISW